MEFFKSVFGWQFQRWGEEEYWFIRTGDDAAPGINGALQKKYDPNMRVTHTVDVPDLDAGIEAIERAGGRIVVPKQLVGDMGWVAYFLDPAGDVHGVRQNREK